MLGETSRPYRRLAIVARAGRRRARTAPSLRDDRRDRVSEFEVDVGDDLEVLFVTLLDQMRRQPQGVERRVLILDNYVIHKSRVTPRWLARISSSCSSPRNLRG